MSRNLSLVEPHPSVPSTGGYVHAGRGGAGNYKHYQPSTLTSGPSATGPASRISLSKPFSKRPSAPHPTGRGGAGNMFKPSSTGPGEEERVFQFDEEMVRRREGQGVAPVYHIGRGGAANVVKEERPGRTERVGSTASVLSSSSEGSGGGKKEGAFAKLARRFS
ncbi:uncharacterized protein LTR77_009435 [Saxophila tyrrhenica]|uniref:Uncharacterized protein n=1 Tax=Saxophila tyrrhenica TaxID=1690608 RepID=A0AAV9P0E8_9PEZI|nr:hypothetical protein LTR77_009435 [Saxophila tyrrhenica]